MVLKQNTRFEYQYPVTLQNGAAIGKDRPAFCMTGELRKKMQGFASWSQKSGHPPGYLSPYSWYLPTKSGGLACVSGIAGTGTMTNPGSLAKGIRISGTIPCASTVAATIEGIGELCNVGNPLAGYGYIREQVVERLVDYTFETGMDSIAAWTMTEFVQDDAVNTFDVIEGANHSGTYGGRLLVETTAEPDSGMIFVTSPADIPVDFAKLSFWMRFKQGYNLTGAQATPWLCESDGTNPLNLAGGMITGQWDYMDELLSGAWVHLVFEPSKLDQTEWAAFLASRADPDANFSIQFEADGQYGDICEVYFDDIEVFTFVDPAEFVGNAQLAGLVELLATLAGEGSLEADIVVIAEIVAAIAGTCTVTADISAPVALTVTINGSGDVTVAHLYAGMWLESSIAGEGIVFDADIMAEGNMSCNINVSGEGVEEEYPSAEEVAAAVWEELLVNHPTVGTAGKALASAGSASDPWSTPLPGIYPAGTAGYLIGQTESIIASLAVIRGLSRENFLMKDQVYDSEKRLLSATVCIYESKADCESDTDPIETYSVTSTYGAGAEFRMVKL